MPEFSHPGIHERDPGTSALPGLQSSRVQARPGERIELGAPVLGRKLGEVEEDVPRELAPSDLGEELLCRVRVGSLRVAGQCLMPYLVWADLAPSQVRGQAGSHGAVGPVTLCRVVGQIFGQERFKAGVG